jgi:ethanolamine utilization protein EutA
MSSDAGLVKLVGLDIGSTTTSALVATARIVHNCVTGRAEFGELTERFRAEPVFTPFRDQRLDEPAIEGLLDDWLARGDVRPGEAFGGGVLVTGLAARQANAAAITSLVRRRLGGAVVARADDPGLESWLTFQANCGDLSRAAPHATFVNLDIGGGTTNLASGTGGEVGSVGCLYVGARHVQVKPGTYRLTRLSPLAVELLAHLQIDRNVGDELSPAEVEAIVDFYTATIEGAVRGDREFLARPCVRSHVQLAFAQAADAAPVFTLSGGVGELVYRHVHGESLPTATAFGDLGIDLARRVAGSPLLSQHLRSHVPARFGRATVYGLAIHNTEVSGATLYLPRPEILPLEDLPIVGHLSADATEEHTRRLIELAKTATQGACLRVECPADDWRAVKAVGQRLADALESSGFPPHRPLVLLVAGNVGKALGQYASRWGALPIDLLVIDEVPARQAHFTRIGLPSQNGVPVSFYGFH